MVSTLAPRTLATALPAIDGAVITPDDPRYDDTRAVFSGVYDDRPAVVVRPCHSRDVAAVVRFAARAGVDLAVRSGGHSAAGYGSVDGGIVIDLRDLTGVQIDPESRSAWAGTGMNAGTYTAVVSEHGLLTPFGDSGAVGIGGITLTGGVGFLTRKLGLTVDSVLAAEVVTADGEIVIADDVRHPDLFWAIRGGGGNFGVVTQFRYRLHPIDRVIGGSIAYAATPANVARLVEIADTASDDLGVIANVAPSADGPLLLSARVAHAGSATDAERDLARLRSLDTPVVDDIAPRRYRDLVPPPRQTTSTRPGSTSVARSVYADTLDLATATALVETIDGWEGAKAKGAQIRILGGEAARRPHDSTAYAHRSRRVLVNVSAAATDPGERDRWWPRVDEVVSAIDPGDGAAYAAFLGREGAERVRAAYPGDTWDRLALVKGRYDPANVFHVNQNIPPATDRRGESG